MVDIGDALKLELRVRHRRARNRLIGSMKALLELVREHVAERKPELCQSNGRLSNARLFNALNAGSNLESTWSTASGLIKNDDAGSILLNMATARAVRTLAARADVEPAKMHNFDADYDAYVSALAPWRQMNNSIALLEGRFYRLLESTKDTDEIRLADLADRDAVEQLCRMALRQPMVAGDRATALENMEILSGFLLRGRQRLKLKPSDHLALLDPVLRTSAFICYRVGDDRHAMFVDLMRRLPENDLLQQEIWCHEHYGDLAGDAAKLALDHAHAKWGVARKGGLKGRSDDLTRVFVFASEVGIHRGAGLDGCLSGDHGLRIGGLLAEAYESACERDDLDSAFRFRTVPVRASLWEGDLRRASLELAQLDIELDDAETRHGQRLKHVRHRIAIDKALLAYLRAGRDDSDREANVWLNEGRRIANQLGIPFLTRAHEREYGAKWDAFSDDV